MKTLLSYKKSSNILVTLECYYRLKGYLATVNHLYLCVIPETRNEIQMTVTKPLNFVDSCSRVLSLPFGSITISGQIIQDLNTEKEGLHFKLDLFNPKLTIEERNPEFTYIGLNK